MPEGVTVKYENNAQTEEGVYQVKAIFYLNGSIIESRYAVLTIEPAVTDRLVLNKTVFEQGEDILVTATAPADSENKTWWVGLYLIGDEVKSDESIYWYYLKDDKHTNGATYGIRSQSHNTSRGEYVNIPVGKYKVVLFNTSGYTVEKTVEIEVVAPTSTEKGTLVTDKTTYTEGETVTVTATCPDKAGNETYWVGLYLADETPSDTVKSIYWYYVKDETHVSGTAYDIKQQKKNEERAEYFALPAGKYKLLLFNARGAIEATVEITVVGA